MKPWLSLFLTLALILSLAACGSAPADGTAARPQAHQVPYPPFPAKKRPALGRTFFLPRLARVIDKPRDHPVQ